MKLHNDISQLVEMQSKSWTTTYISFPSFKGKWNSELIFQPLWGKTSNRECTQQPWLPSKPQLSDRYAPVPSSSIHYEHTTHLQQKSSPPVVSEPRPHLVHLLRQASNQSHDSRTRLSPPTTYSGQRSNLPPHIESIFPLLPNVPSSAHLLRTTQSVESWRGDETTEEA
jgi:hypothetical protein